jgi:putative ABC transport system ATP-binding protein
MPDLNIHDLVVEYSSGGYAVRPIDGLDLDVPAGSLVILLGPSGCGKTTLLSCLGGILSPTSGEITFGDRVVTGLDGKAMADYRRNTVGIVFQAFNLVPSLTALENVMIPLRIAGTDEAEAKRRAMALLERVGLGGRVQHRPSELSGGEQQRTAVARALAADPSVLLADEPSGNLDHHNSERLHELFTELAHELELGMVVVTHNRSLAARADRVLQLEDGRLTHVALPEVVA